jgi:hypothetical protein
MRTRMTRAEHRARTRTRRASHRSPHPFPGFEIAGMIFVLLIGACIAADVWFSHTVRML